MASRSKQRQKRIAQRNYNRTSYRTKNYTNFNAEALLEDLKKESEETEINKSPSEQNIECDNTTSFARHTGASFYEDKPLYTGKVRKGEIYFFYKTPTVGVEQQGGRPGIIVSNNLCNEHSEFVEVIYTTCQEKTELPTHVAINSTPKPCTALCEQIHTLSKKKIQCYYGEVAPEELVQINEALKVNFSLDCTSNDVPAQDYTEEIAHLRMKNEELLKENEELLKKLEQAELVEPTINEVNVDYKKVYDDLLDKILNKLGGTS